MSNTAVFMFLAASAVSLFAFLSIAAWAGARTAERRARDRFALLKTLGETPGENASRVLDLLREHDAIERATRESEERKGYLVGGLVCVAVGLGLSTMVVAVASKPGLWTLGLIPGLIGVVLTLVGFFSKPGR